MGKKLRNELQRQVPDRIITGPEMYTFLMRDLSQYAQDDWGDFVSTFKAGPYLEAPSDELVAAGAFDAYDSDGESSDTNGRLYDEVYVTSYERKNKVCFNCQKTGHMYRDCPDTRCFKTIHAQKEKDTSRFPF